MKKYDIITEEEFAKRSTIKNAKAKRCAGCQRPFIAYRKAENCRACIDKILIGPDTLAFINIRKKFRRSR